MLKNGYCSYANNNNQHLLGVSHMPDILNVLSCLIITRTTRGQYYNHHFPDEETEAQKC